MKEKTKEKIEKFVKKLKEIFGEKLKSCIVYGSIAKGTYRESISDINMIAVIDEIDYEEIEKIKNDLSKIAIKNMIRVFFFTDWFLSSSSDVFPVEWKDIKENHIVVFGDDITERITIKEENLRIQLERESKQNYLNFQQGLLFEKDMLFLLSNSIKNLKLILKDIDLLTEEKIETPEYFEKVEMVEKGKEKMSKEELKKIAKQHFNFLSKVIRLIDRGGKI